MTPTTTMSGILLLAVQKHDQRDKARARLRRMDEELAQLVGQLDPEALAEYDARTDPEAAAVAAIATRPEQPSAGDEAEAGFEDFWQDDHPSGPFAKLRDAFRFRGSDDPPEGAVPFGHG